MNLVAKDEVIKATPPSVDSEGKDNTPGEFKLSPGASVVHENGVYKKAAYKKVKKVLTLDVYFYVASAVSLFLVAVFGLWFFLVHSKSIDEQILKSNAAHSVLQRMLQDLSTSHTAYVEAAAGKTTMLDDIEVNDKAELNGEGAVVAVQNLQEQGQEDPRAKQHILQQRIDGLSQQIALLSQDNYELRQALHFGAQDNSSKDAKSNSAAQKQSTPTSVNALSTLDITTLIHSAYTAFSDQRIEKAGVLYQQALQQSPQNRDANLGVAKIAILQGNSVLAADRYRHLLVLDPVDLDAFTAMLALSESNDSLEVEMVGHIAKYEPESYILYSALGRYYSRKAKWDLAVLAFEKSIDANSPVNDYFNFAISLDHAGDQKRALDYYQKALNDVPTEKGVSPPFSLHEVRARVAEISGRVIPDSRDP